MGALKGSFTTHTKKKGCSFVDLVNATNSNETKQIVIQEAIRIFSSSYLYLIIDTYLPNAILCATSNGPRPRRFQFHFKETISIRLVTICSISITDQLYLK